MSCPKSVTEDRVVCLTKSYSDVVTNLTLRRLRATRLLDAFPGLKSRAESLNRFAVNSTDLPGVRCRYLLGNAVDGLAGS
jgi:hypothetical protein